MKKKNIELIRDILLDIIFIVIIIIFINSIVENFKILGLAFLLFCANYLIIVLHERKYKKKNFPYKPYKSKKKISKRILIGMLAGLHYSFFIGNYNHKKYNTQVRYPETIECFFGNVSQMIILLLYLWISVTIFKRIGYYSLLFMVIPIITSITSLIIHKK